MAKLKIATRFGVAPNVLLNDSSISLKAKGLYTYLQSKPDDWDFSGHRIKNDSSDGRDGVYSALKELEEAGYLRRVKYQVKSGHWDYEYTLYDTPSTKIKEITEENPCTEIPYTDEPYTEKPYYNKERSTNKEIQRKSIYILDFWNHKEITKHKENPTILKAIDKALKIFDQEDIEKGINNYHQILTHPNTYFKHKWTLTEFLSRKNGLAVFIYKTPNDYLKSGINEPTVYKNTNGVNYAEKLKEKQLKN